MHKIVLSLGSNKGDKEKNLRQALSLLAQNGIKIHKVSKTIITPPWGNWKQEDFMNLVLIGETYFEPTELLKTLKDIEKTMGRKEGHMQPRIIDIDIILFDDLILKTDTLKIPHPSFRERLFVLKPLFEIEPDLHDPETGKTVSTLYEELLSMPFVGHLSTEIGDFYVSVKNGKVVQTSFDYIKGRQEYTPLLGRLLDRLNKYFNGEKVEFNDFPLNFYNISELYKRIYTALRKIPYGRVISYSQLAELAGITNGARVVGNAMAKNPFPIVVPCHRVIRKDGSLGGYSSGIERKTFLLKLELRDMFFDIFPKSPN